MKTFATEIKALDPLNPQESPRTWAGPNIQAKDWEEAELFCKEHQGYLKVIGVLEDGIVFGNEMATPDTTEIAYGEEPEPLIKTGDVVILKSGGPFMTVNSYSDNWTECLYFVDRELFERNFDPSMLIVVNRLS